MLGRWEEGDIQEVKDLLCQFTDTKKMPLGKLSKPQIAKGFAALEAIEEALKSSAPRSRLAELSSTFYTIIPHDFGRRVPPVIVNQEMLQKKFDMLLVSRWFLSVSLCVSVYVCTCLCV